MPEKPNFQKDAHKADNATPVLTGQQWLNHPLWFIRYEYFLLQRNTYFYYCPSVKKILIQTHHFFYEKESLLIPS